MFLKLGMQHKSLKVNEVYINEDPGLTERSFFYMNDDPGFFLDLFYSKVDFGQIFLLWLYMTK